MQSVITGQVPVTLERKITSRGKKKKTEDKTITETNRILVYTSDKNKKVRSAYVRIKIISYAKRVAAETEAEETA